MFADASAIVAILIREPGWEGLAAKLGAVTAPSTSSLAIYEAVLAVRRIARAEPGRVLDRVEQFLGEAQVRVIPVTEDIGRAALDAFARYGKGQGHPAQLNMGDCFAYACARTLGVPLLSKGDDFAATDLA